MEIYFLIPLEMIYGFFEYPISYKGIVCQLFYLLFPQEELTSCSSVVRALVCQPSGSGSNPDGIVQSQLVQGEKPIQLLPTLII